MSMLAEDKEGSPARSVRRRKGYRPMTIASFCPLAVEQCRRRQQTCLDDQMFRNRLIGSVIDRNRPAVNFAAHLATSTPAFGAAEPFFKEPSADPDAVGLQWIVGKHWKVDRFHFQLDVDAKFRQGLSDLLERLRNRIAGGSAAGTCPTLSINESLPSNCQCLEHIPVLVSMMRRLAAAG